MVTGTERWLASATVSVRRETSTPFLLGAVTTASLATTMAQTCTRLPVGTSDSPATSANVKLCSGSAPASLASRTDRAPAADSSTSNAEPVLLNFSFFGLILAPASGQLKRGHAGHVSEHG